ncbi:MAG: sigma-70 family RNA polymerase sigma factor [bacterium]
MNQATDETTTDNDETKPIEDMTEEEKQEVFGEEALPHLNALYNYARSISHSKQDAEDLVQETFMRAYRYFHQYTPGTNCKAWLFTILRNLYNTNYKQYKKTPDQVHYEAEEEIYEQIVNEDLTAVIKDPEEEFFENILPDEIVNAIEDLPEKYRSCIVLSDVEDFSYKEISEILDVPIGTVMSRLHRGRNILKKKLVNYAKDKGIIPEDEDVLDDED